MTPELEKRLRLLIDFPSPAGVAAQVIDVASDPEADLGRVAQVIGQDPALSAKMLRTANSAFYAGRRKSQNLRQAIVVLGLNATLTLALGFSLLKTYGQLADPGVDYHRFWRRALLSAIAARAVSQVRGLPDEEEEAFLAALLQDIGILAIDRSHEAFYRELPQDVSHDALSAFQRTRLGYDHAQVGAWLLRSWKIPALLCDAVEASHQLPPPSPPAERSPFMEGVALSGVLADSLLVSERGAPPRPLSEQEQGLLALDEVALEDILAKIKERIPETESLFERDIMPAWELEALISRAHEALMIRSLDTLKRFENLTEEHRVPSARTKELWQAATLDILTDVFNRRHFEEQLQTLFAQAQRADWPLSLLFADLDHFKQVNDAYGHQAGDEVLRTAAGLLRGHLREDDLVARYGGEEFVVLMPGTGFREAARVAERLVRAFREHAHAVGPQRFRVTVSIGVATRDPGHPFAQAQELLRAADRAVYAAKQQGRDRVVACLESQAS